MDVEAADALELLVERSALWDGDELARLHRRLAAEPDAAALDLARAFRALQLRLQMGPVSDRLRRDIEGIFYPRLWKVLEAVRGGLPAGEQLARVQVLNRRLAHLFADEGLGETAGST